jgi:hypothetical protein
MFRPATGLDARAWSTVDTIVHVKNRRRIQRCRGSGSTRARRGSTASRSGSETGERVIRHFLLIGQSSSGGVSTVVATTMKTAAA